MFGDEPSYEKLCPVCKGTGEDPRVEDAPCRECWGDGTIVVNSDE